MRCSILAFSAFALFATRCSQRPTLMQAVAPAQQEAGAAARLIDTASGADWPAYGRTYGEQHYSPLALVNGGNVGQLGLAWSIDLDTRNSATAPLAVDGIL